MKKMVVWLLVMLCLFALAGCGEPAEEKEPQLSYGELVEAPLDKDIRQLITSGEVSTIIGTPMQVEDVYEDGTQLVFVGDNDNYRVVLNVQNMSRAVFDGHIADALDAQPIENLGEVAYVLGSGETVLAYGNGYGIDVQVRVMDRMVVQPRAEAIVKTVLGALA